MLHDALIYLLAAVIAVPIFQRLGLGGVLGYLVAGIVIGPAGIGLTQDPENVLHFAEFGVVLLLFLIGLELNFHKLWALRVSIFGMGALQVLSTALVIGAIALLLNIEWRIAVVAGMAFAMSSTAIALAYLQERRLLTTAGGQSSFSVLLFQDLAVIPALLLLALLAPAKSAGALNWLDVAEALGLIIGFIVIGRFVIRHVLRFIANTGLREVFVAFALLLVFGAALGAQSVGLSMALGTFLAGVLLADSEYRHELELDIAPFKGLLLGLFFIAVGMTIDVSLFLSAPLTVFGIAFAVVAIKFGLLLLSARLFKIGTEDGALFAVALSQVGEFAFVLISTAQGSGLVPKPQADLMNAIVAVSMLSTPFLFIAFKRYTAKRLQDRHSGPAEVIEERNDVIVAGFGRVGQVVTRLLVGRGHRVTIIEHDPNQIELVRRFGWKAYYGDVTRLDVLHAAGIETARLLVIAIDDSQAVLETVKRVRERYADVKLVVRARNRTDAFDLLEHGIEFERETFRGGVALGQKALLALGDDAEVAERSAQAFIEHDEALLATTVTVRDDHRRLMAITHRSRKDLEDLLTGERKPADSESPP